MRVRQQKLDSELMGQFTTAALPIQTLGVNFINILRAAFTWKDPKSAKKDIDDLTVFLHFWDQ